MKKLFADKPVARLAFMIARGMFLIYMGFTLYLAFFQRRALYYPLRAPEPDLTRIAEQAGLAPWRNADQTIIGWQPSETIPAGANLMLAFHGNAGFALHRTYFTEGFQHAGTNAMFYVFLMEYPGYGARPGSPTEDTMKQAAQEALAQLHQDHPESQIFLLGESIGSGVAAWLAGQSPSLVAGVFLITPFDRLTHVAAHHYPIMPVRLLLRDRFESDKALQAYPGPVGILIAGNDNVIPPQFGRALYDGIAGPKRLWIQEKRNHNTLDYAATAEWWNEAHTFLVSPTHD